MSNYGKYKINLVSWRSKRGQIGLIFSRKLKFYRVAKIDYQSRFKLLNIHYRLREGELK